MKTDIQNAVNAGKVVTVSKANISYKGWNGCGYIVINPETGAGAYMISGGINGGVIIEKNWAANLLDYLKDPASNAWLGYISGASSALGNVGIALGLVITTFMIFFTITDILVNQDGTLSKKGDQIISYATIQSLEIFTGFLSAKNAATFVATLIMNFLYLELLSSMLQKSIKGGQ